MANNGGIGPLPFRLADFLQSSYYVISVVVILLGFVGFLLALKGRVDDMEEREHQHPTLAEVAVKVDNRIGSLERHIENMDAFGSRALTGRTALLEQENHIQAERIVELVHRMDDMQTKLNRLDIELPVVIDRQSTHSDAIKALQERLWLLDGGDHSQAPVPKLH